jgi:hypothetical protein
VDGYARTVRIGYIERIGQRQVKFAHVVDKAGNGEKVQGTKGAVSSCSLWIVMVVMYGKDGYGNVEVWIFIIYCWKAMCLCLFKHNQNQGEK